MRGRAPAPINGIRGQTSTPRAIWVNSRQTPSTRAEVPQVNSRSNGAPEWGVASVNHTGRCCTDSVDRLAPVSSSAPSARVPAPVPVARAEATSGHCCRPRERRKATAARAAPPAARTAATRIRSSRSRPRNRPKSTYPNHCSTG
ncbi:hypothetical protein ACFFX0_24650 [Citricoccus parietis]|uniref:Uncharacterized protein n=1 Tax=Citricoccus parietis TaxID=592307 RepID=A0ABV5G5P3_9MICC